MKCLSLFSGIGAFEKALKNIDVNVELVGFSEIDKYAIKSYCAIHGVDESLNLGDISKIDLDSLPNDVELITHGSPCQDFSIAGKLAGGDKGSGTRSSLMWCTVDIVEKIHPKYVIWENVKNLLSSKNRHNFDNYLEMMDKLGYNSYYKVLNSKDYGIPQNRERVFTVSIRKDIDKGYEFPEEIELTKRLKDILEPEDEVDEKYYLDKERTEKLIREKKSIRAVEDWEKPKCIRIGGIFDTEKSKHQAGSIYDKNGLSPTLDIAQGGWRQPSVIIRDKIRRLTPKEYWKLMGFSDEDFERAKRSGDL